MAYNRKIPNMVKDNEQEITNKSVIMVKDGKYDFIAIAGQCHGCKTPNDPRECICCTCIGKGITHKSLRVECRDFVASK